MILFNTSAIPTALGAIEVAGERSIDIQRVAHDSRAVGLGGSDAFFCLVTRTGNGHRYIAQAYRRGVRCFVVSEWDEAYTERYREAVFIRVPDTLGSLQSLAQAHRQRIGAHIVAITGSNGKTIVKEMLYTLLYRQMPRLYRSPGSYNSQVGVALALLSMPLGTELAFIEAGISEPGEMIRLREMIQPDEVLLTHLGVAHREHFADLATLYAEKLLLAHRAQTLYYYMDPEETHADEVQSAIDSLHSIAPSLQVYDVYAAYGQQREGSNLALGDRASRENIALALGYIAERLPQHYAEALRHLHELTPLPMRLELKENALGHLLINDSYSNDLDALDLALGVLASYHGRALVLGRIEQTGLSPEALARALGDRFRARALERVYLVGWTEPLLLAETDGLRLSHSASIEALMQDYREELLAEQALLVKGSRQQQLEELVRQLALREHTTRLEVDLGALRRNLSYYRSRLPEANAFICMIKADAYGLGALEIARLLCESRQVQYLAVAVADEGKALRTRGIDADIIVMNPQVSSLQTLQAYRLDAEVYSLELLELFGRSFQPEARPGLHLKVDSGMHRLGFSEEDIPAIVALVEQYDIRLSSIFSHLAGADEAVFDDFTAEQAERFRSFATKLIAALPQQTPPLLHLLNTAGLERFAEPYPFGGARLGIGLYGFSPSGRSEVQPVARLTTSILQIKEISAGETVGYGRRGQLERNTRIGVLPIGYADGLLRRYGNGRWQVEVDGQLCPIVGNVCMDACMIDLSAAPEAQVGARVVVFGAQGNSLERMAEVGDTIPYEVLTCISPRVARIYINS
ncbi:MAG: alanine racemase [Porphyromonas sp.]|nr:alanine racemase [Porphyromonas sp.]